MTGNAQVVFAKLPAEFDQRFEYRSVNGPDDLAAIDTARLPRPLPRLSRDSLARLDSLRRDRLARMTPEQRAAAQDSVRRSRDSLFRANLRRRDSTAEARENHRRAQVSRTRRAGARMHVDERVVARRQFALLLVLVFGKQALSNHKAQHAVA